LVAAAAAAASPAVHFHVVGNTWREERGEEIGERRGEERRGEERREGREERREERKVSSLHSIHSKSLRGRI